MHDEQVIKEILEILSFLKANAVTKDEFNNLKDEFSNVVLLMIVVCTWLILFILFEVCLVWIFDTL